MPDFELWHSYRNWAICSYVFDPVTNFVVHFPPHHQLQIIYILYRRWRISVTC
jgi:hypothetical protein